METGHLDQKMLKPFEEMLRCRICSEFFRGCVMTSCSHNFCSACLKKRLETESDCPTCYEDIQERDFRSNRSLDKIVRIYRKLIKTDTTQSLDQSQISLQSPSVPNSHAISQPQNCFPVQISSTRTVPVQSTPRISNQASTSFTISSAETVPVHSISSTGTVTLPLIQSLPQTFPVKQEMMECSDSEMQDLVLVSTTEADSEGSLLADSLLAPSSSSSHPVESHNYFSSYLTQAEFQAFQKRNFKELNDIKVMLENMEDTLRSIRMALEGPSREPLPEGAPKLPLRTTAEVLQLEHWLLERDHKSSLLNYLSLIGGKDMEKSTRNIMVHLFSNEVAAQYNWAGRGEKIAFSTLKVKNVIVGAVLRYAAKEPANTITRVEEVIKTWLKSAKLRK